MPPPTCQHAQNPSNQPPGVPHAGPEPDYSEPQAKRFKSAAWIGVEDPTMLDVEGTELLLVAARDDPVGAWGRGVGAWKVMACEQGVQTQRASVCVWGGCRAPAAGGPR